MVKKQSGRFKKSCGVKNIDKCFGHLIYTKTAIVKKIGVINNVLRRILNAIYWPEWYVLDTIKKLLFSLIHKCSDLSRWFGSAELGRRKSVIKHWKLLRLKIFVIFVTCVWAAFIQDLRHIREPSCCSTLALSVGSVVLSPAAV